MPPYYVTVEAILSSDSRYKDRATNAADTVRNSAYVLASRLDQVFALYKQDKRPHITSGYRPPAANKAAGGASKSAHLEGRACDFEDGNGEFAQWCLNHLYVLEENNLWMEDPLATKGWVHLQSRPARNRVFKP